MTPHDDAGFGWKEYLGNEMVRAVLITTPERYYPPSWAHYLTAEGNDREVSIHFVTCVVRVKGFGLDRLLRKLIIQRIAEYSFPSAPTGSANPDNTPGISQLSVEATEGGQCLTALLPSPICTPRCVRPAESRPCSCRANRRFRYASSPSPPPPFYIGARSFSPVCFLCSLSAALSAPQTGRLHRGAWPSPAPVCRFTRSAVLLRPHRRRPKLRRDVRATVTPGNGTCHAVLRAAGLLRGLLAFSLPFAAVCSAFPLRGNKPPPTERKNNMNKTKNNPETPKAAPTYQNQVRLIGFLGESRRVRETRDLLACDEDVVAGQGFGQMGVSHRVAPFRRVGRTGEGNQAPRQGRLRLHRR